MENPSFLKIGSTLINLEKITYINLTGLEKKVVINFQDKDNYRYFYDGEAEALRKYFRGETDEFKTYRIIQGWIIDLLPESGETNS